MKLLVQTAQTGVVTDFYNYLQHNPVNEHFDIKARVLEFTATLETDKQQRAQTNNFLFAQYDAKGYGRTGRWIQCAYCKIWYPRHMTLPMIPAADIDNWKTLHHNLCFSCTRSSLDNQLLHPGHWLNVQEPPDIQVGEHTQLQAGTPDLTQTVDRPAVLRTLDQENNPRALGTTPLDISLAHHSRCHIRCFHTPLLEHHPTTLVPHPTGQSQDRPIRKSTTTHLKPVPQHGHQSLEEERILQPIRVHFTTTAGCLQRPVTTSTGTKPHSNQLTLTPHYSQPTGVYLQLVHTFRLSHGPKAQGPISYSPDKVARDTRRTSADRGESPESLHTKPRFYRAPERVVGRHHTLTLQPFPLQESGLQISNTQLTLVTHHGQQLTETRGLLMPKMP